jgi:hypothetical protein
MTYFAGGYFVDGRTLFMSWLEGPPDIGALPPSLRLTKDLPHVQRTPEWTDQTVHFNRLLRDGWTPVPSIDDPKATWERRQPGGDLTLIRAPALDADFTNYGGRHVDDYAVRTPDGELEVFGRGTWADFDQRGRLVVERAGRLVVRGTDAIADFNPHAPDPQPSPPWASEWP